MAGFIRTSQRFQRCEEQRLAAEEVGKIQPGQYKCNRQESEPAGRDKLQNEGGVRENVHDERRGIDLADENGVDKKQDHDGNVNPVKRSSGSSPMVRTLKTRETASQGRMMFI